MPVDLDTQLRALGDVLTRESEPITMDELGAGHVVTPPPAPTRRRWAAVAAIATAAAAIVGIVAVGPADDDPRPGAVVPAPSSAPELTDAPAGVPPLIGVTSFPLIDDPVAVGLTGSPEVTLTSMPATAADGVGAWRAVLGRPDGSGYSDLVLVQIVTGLRAPNANGHVDTSVRELPGFVEYVFDTGDVRIEVQADLPAEAALDVSRSFTFAEGQLPEVGPLPDGLVTVAEPYPITAEAGHFPVLGFERVTISVEPLPPAALMSPPAGALVPVTIAGRPSYLSDAEGQVNMASALGDGMALNISASGMSADEVIAIAETVQLVDQRTWIERYQPRWVDETGATVELPPSLTVPAPATVPETVAEASSGPFETLRVGDAGDRVRAVQEQLTQLGFDPGPSDGVYGTMTEQAVWAFEKLVMGVPRQQATGTVTPEVWERLGSDVVIAPRRPQGPGVDHVEIYLPEQVMVVFHADEPVLITHISTGELDESGEPANWCETITVDTDHEGSPLPQPEEQAICGTSKTPGGIFDVDRLVPGTRVGPLGAMWNPIYFNHGIAIHGAVNVPLEPASHGNVRVPMHVAERLPDLIPIGSQVYVWNGTKEPEDQTREDELPVFDWIDTDP